MEARLKEMDDLSASYHKDNGSFWIAVDKSCDQVIGCVGLLDMGDGRGYLKRMYLDPKYRSAGLGKRLLLGLLDHARAREMRQVYLATDHSMELAQRFYERHGFRRIKELPSDIDPFGDPLFYVIDLHPTGELGFSMTSSARTSCSPLHAVA